jgi:hypothetical protein
MGEINKSMSGLRDKDSTSDAQKAAQFEVQRLLGRCILRLQQYERLIKSIVAHHEISGPPHALEEIRAARVTGVARDTLGALIGDFLGSCVVVVGSGPPPDATADFSDSENFVSFRLRVPLSKADFVKTETELKELVLLRNNLVHHFIAEHDIGSLAGCRNATDALLDAYRRIDRHFEQLRRWADEIDKSRRLLADSLRSNEFLDLANNRVAPDGKRDWANAGIVLALREVTGELAVDGWVSIVEAKKLISERFPDQNPEKYGCSSWRQVVHESRIFELRYLEMDGQRSARYRERARPVSMPTKA